MKRTRALIALITIAIVGSACSTTAAETQTLRVLTHTDFELPAEALAEFTERTGVEVAIFREPDATSVVDLLARTTETPVADVVIGFDTLELSRVIDLRLVEPYVPLDAPFIDELLRVPGDWVTPVSYLDACLNRSVSAYLPPEREPDELPDPEDIPLNPPTGFASFLDPRHAASTVVPDATTDRMGLYFLIALDRAYPENDDPEQLAWPQLIPELLDNGLVITDTWEQAYFEHFIRDDLNEVRPDIDADVLADPGIDTSAGIGLRPVTWGSAGMPAVTVRFRPDLPEFVDIEVIDSGCIRVVNYAGIVQSTPNRRNAGRFMDIVAEPLFQFTIADRFGSRPVRTDLIRTEAWKEFGEVVNPTQLDPYRVGADWEQLQLTWTQVVRTYYESPDPVVEDIELTR